ncbi:MAG TPA: DUF6584 family protein [Phycisphaerales bacterium]|nr:DUF6584 family protein [Phycisphaerales bacterium]
MSAIERAERDEQAGDLGTARMRLMSFVATGDAGPDECERIARLSVRMGDPVEAGRWYFLCDSRDEQAAACIERFIARHGADSRVLRSQLSGRMARFVLLINHPAAAVERLRQAGITFDDDLPVKRNESWSMGDVASLGGCLVVAAFLVIALIVGAVEVVTWIVRKF